MLLKDLELTISHVDLGNLNEFALTTIFGAAQAYRLTSGRGVTLREIADSEGNELYPGYFMTHLKVSPERLLSTFEPWRPLTVGVEHRIFGGMIMDSTYALGDAGKIEDNPASWEGSKLPHMRAGTIFVVAAQKSDPQPKAPHSNCMAELPKLTSPPSCVERFTSIQALGTMRPSAACSLLTKKPITYAIVPGRDVAAGHNIMFASFIKLMDYAERVLLTQHVWPAFPRHLADMRNVLERETYYYGNCGADDEVRIDVCGNLHATHPEHTLVESNGMIAAGMLEFFFELYDKRSNRILLVSRAQKLLTIPTADKTALKDIERLKHAHMNGDV